MQMKRISGDFHSLYHLNLTRSIPAALRDSMGYGASAGVMVFRRARNLDEDSAKTILLELADELATRHGMRPGALEEKIQAAFAAPNRGPSYITRNSDGSYNDDPQIDFMPRRNGYVEILSEHYDDTNWFVPYFDGEHHYSWASRMFQTRFILKEV